MSSLNVIRPLALLIVFCTGFTALVYEVTWHYYLANLLGSHARSSSIIVGTFLGGLAVGYLRFGNTARWPTPRALVEACGVMEALIGVWALAFPYLYQGAWTMLFEFRVVGESLATDILVAVVLIGIPTNLMGATLPLLTQGLSKSMTDAAPFHARIYVINTLGAFLGSLTAGFILIRLLGLSTTMATMGVVNIIAGIVLFSFGRRLKEVPVLPEEPVTQVTPFEPKGKVVSFLFVAFLAGLASITVQTILIRVVALSMGSSVYAFAMVVSAYILVLAAGAWLLAERIRISIPVWLNQSFVAVGLLLLYVAVPYLPYSAHVIRTLLTSQWPNFWVFHAAIFVALCLLIALPIGAVGATLPILFREARDRPELLGRRVGLIYSLNAVGCVCGAIIGGYLSLYYLNLDDVLRAATYLSIFTLLSTALLERTRRRTVVLVSALLAATTLLSALPWPDEVLGQGTFRMTTAESYSYKGFEAFYKRFKLGSRVIAYKDDPNSTISVTDSGGSRSIIVNGKSDGATSGGDRTTTKLMAHIPLLYQTSNSKNAAIIGFGTGITVGSLAKFEEIEEIDVLEIAHAVKQFAPLFDPYNSQASQSPKLRWQLIDAYRYLLKTDRQYAVIVSEPSNPWVGGVERLYTSEFYQLVKRKLAPGGIFAGWFHTYSISEKTLSTVLKTFSSSFNHVHLFDRSSDIVLIGSDTPLGTQALKNLRERISRPVIAADLQDIGYGQAEYFLTTERWVPLEKFASAELHSLDKPKLSYWAGRDFFLEANTNIENLLNTLPYKAAARKAFSRTILGRSVLALGDREALTSIAIMACGQGQLTFFQDWDKSWFPCRGPLAALQVRGYLEAANGMPPNMLSALRGVQKREAGFVEPPVTSQEASYGLWWMSDYGLPFLAFDSERMRMYAANCYKDKTGQGTTCRVGLIIALLSNGFEAEARSEYERLKFENLALPSQLESVRQYFGEDE